MLIINKVFPRKTPDREAKYMGLAWFYASFSKDPNTQVGAVIVDEYNYPLGCGYNGPPRLVDDNSFSWERSVDSEKFGKNDIIIHAEINAIEHSCGKDLSGSTLYVTGLPCPKCMLYIANKEMKLVVYMDYRSDSGSSLQNTQWRDKSLEIAEMGQVKVKEFKGGVAWMADWILRLKEMRVLGS